MSATAASLPVRALRALWMTLPRPGRAQSNSAVDSADTAAIHPDLRDLIRLRSSSRRLRLPVANAPVGDAISDRDRRGRGLEYDHSRRYVWGDDARRIDWRATARRGALHTRIYRTERARTVLCVVDNAASMHFGTRGAFMASTAARAAAACAWAAVDGQERCALVVGGNGHRPLIVAPTTGQRGALAVLRGLAGIRPEVSADAPDGEAFERTLDAAASLTRPGALVLVFSNFHAWSDASAASLSRLANTRTVLAVWVHDHLEREAPPPGDYPVLDGAGRWTLVIDGQDHAVWRDSFEQRRLGLTARCARAGVALLELPAECEPVTALARALAKRGA